MSIDELKDAIANHPLVQSSAYFYAADQLRRGIINRSDLADLLTWIEDGQAYVDRLDIAGWIGTTDRR